MEIRIKASVKGYVQGVGFRYFCYRKAQEFDIKGYVKNCIDGSVELEAEGNASLIKDFIKELNIGPRGASVKSVNVEELPFENKFSEFKMY